MKKRFMLGMFFLLCCVGLSGCSKKCEGCGKEIEKDAEVEIEDKYYCDDCVEYCAGCNTAYLKDSKKLQTIDGKNYCENCVEYCASCNTAFVKGSNELQEVDGKKYCENCVEHCAGCNKAFLKGSDELLTYKKKHYCKDCFDELAFPITLEKNDKVTVKIIGYDDNDGSFAVKIKNKTKYNMSIYQEGESVLLDGKERCIAETDGTYSFAYVDVPAKEDVTVFSTFRKSADEWDTVLKMSDNHKFEFAMTAWINDTNYSDYWSKNFKVELTHDMFGYVK